MNGDVGRVTVISDMRFRLDGDVLLSEAQVTGAIKALICDGRTRDLTLVGRPLRDRLEGAYRLEVPAHVNLADLPDWNRLEAFACLYELWRVLRRVAAQALRRGDAVVVFMPTLAGFLALAGTTVSRRRPGRVVAVVRGSLTQTLRLQPRIAASSTMSFAVTVFGSMSRWLIAMADEVVCVSRWLAGEVGQDRAVIAPEVDWEELRRRAVPSRERRGVVYLGRLEPEKGVDVIVDAATGGGSDSHLPLTVVGGGSLRQDLERRVKETGADDSVRFTGPLERDEVFKHLAAARVVVVPSRSEGFGLSALEAALSGARVLYSPVGGLPEALAWASSALPVPGFDWRVWRRSMTEALALPTPTTAPGAEDVRTAMGWSRLQDVVFDSDQRV